MNSITRLFLLVITLLTLAYAVGGLVVMIHQNGKFRVCVQKWEDARRAGDLPAMWLYSRCEELAHEDSLALGKSPAEWRRRWNADYELEASGGR